MTDQSTPFPHETSTEPSSRSDPHATRKHWLRVMAMTSPTALAAQIDDRLENEDFTWLRTPETGHYRVQGRLDCGGNRFNLADVVVTRSIVRSEFKTAGVGYVQGRNPVHSTLVAQMDSLLQTPQFQSKLIVQVISPLAERLSERHRTEREQVERSRVQFYTLTPESV